MKHLSVEEIIKYVTATEVNNEMLDLFSRVNGHIRKCEMCKEKIVAYEHVNNMIIDHSCEKEFDLNQFDDLSEIINESSN